MAEQISFTLPNPYQAEQADIARRQRMAEIMQQQAFQPAETFSYGGIQARTSPLTSLAKALQGYVAGKTQRDLVEEQKALGERAQRESASDFATLFEHMRGQEALPERPPVTAVDDQGNFMPNQPAVAARARGIVDPSILTTLRDPQAKQLAMSQLLAQMKGPESAFGKVDAKDYTPESVRAFAAGGSKDYSVLVPVRKQEMATTVGPNGQTISVPFNPYAPPPQGFVQPMGGFVGTLQQLGLLTPEMMQKPQVQQVLSGYIGKETGQVTPVEFQRLQIDLARLRDQQVRTQAETGMSAGVPNAPQTFNLFGQPAIAASTVMNAPRQGVAPTAPATQGAPGMGLPVDLSRTGLPLKTQRDIQKELLTGEVKKQLEAKEALPMQLAQGQNMLDLIDRMVGTVDKKGNVVTQPHPGISTVGSAIGRLGAYVPGSSGADFMSMYDQVKGQAFLEAVQKMRGSGAISEIEGQKAASAITRMNTSQSREEFVRAAREFQDSMRRGMQDAQKRAGGLSQGAQDALNAVMGGRR